MEIIKKYLPIFLFLLFNHYLLPMHIQKTKPKDKYEIMQEYEKTYNKNNIQYDSELDKSIDFEYIDSNQDSEQSIEYDTDSETEIDNEIPDDNSLNFDAKTSDNNKEIYEIKNINQNINQIFAIPRLIEYFFNNKTKIDHLSTYYRPDLIILSKPIFRMFLRKIYMDHFKKKISRSISKTEQIKSSETFKIVSIAVCTTAIIIIIYKIKNKQSKDKQDKAKQDNIDNYSSINYKSIVNKR